MLICHPRLVQTGLDLVDFPTICWYETDYSVYTMRQASRRSWRIGQTRPVKVVFFAYRNTLQADALKLVAKKLQSSLAVEGELPEDGLAAYGDDGDDLLLALARQVVNGATDGETVEDVFAQASTAAAAAEELLVDDGWRAVEIEPDAIAGQRSTGRPATAIPRPSTSGRASSRTSAAGTTPTATGTTTRCRRHSRRCSRGPSSWPRSQPSRRAGNGSRSPQQRRSSSGRWNRSGSRLARDARSYARGRTPNPGVLPRPSIYAALLRVGATAPVDDLFSLFQSPAKW